MMHLTFATDITKKTVTCGDVHHIVLYHWEGIQRRSRVGAGGVWRERKIMKREEGCGRRKEGYGAGMKIAVGHCIIVRQLRAIFEMDVDAPDKSTKFVLRVAYCMNLTFLVGTSLFAFVYGRYHGFKMAAM